MRSTPSTAPYGMNDRRVEVVFPGPGSAASEAITLTMGVALRTLGQVERRQLLRLLEDSLAEPRVSEKRYARIGLMVEMILEAGLLPTGEEYDDRVRQERLAGRDWPDRRSLCRAYGRWEQVVYAVVRFLNQGSSARVPISNKHGYDRPAPGTYNPRLIAKWAIRCRDFLQRWPSHAEFERWAKAQRASARAAGQPLPHVPSNKPIFKAFPAWDAVIAFAMKYEESEAVLAVAKTRPIDASSGSPSPSKIMRTNDDGLLALLLDSPPHADPGSPVS